MIRMLTRAGSTLALVIAACASPTTHDAGTDLGPRDAHADLTSFDAATDSGPTDLGRDIGFACGPYWSMAPPFDRGCAVDADCIVGLYATSCCTAVATGLNIAERTRFDDAMRACDMIPHTDCGCVFRLAADDGTDMTLGTFSTSEVAIRCDSGICATTIRGYTLCPGTSSCGPGTHCGSRCAGLPDGGTLALPYCLPDVTDCGATPVCACTAAAGIHWCAGGTCVDTADGGYGCTCP